MHRLKVIEQASILDYEFIVIIVTSYDDAAYLERAFDLGAKAFVLKDAAANDLLDCLKTVVSGGKFISPSLGSHEPKLPELGEGSTDLLSSLTNMELTVLFMVADFKTSKQVALDLSLSYRTVQNHRANICRKLELHGPHQLMNFARSHKDVIQRFL
jgi:DNA-binding NarL/FixJ family response regulator